MSAERERLVAAVEEARYVNEVLNVDYPDRGLKVRNAIAALAAYDRDHKEEAR